MAKLGEVLGRGVTVAVEDTSDGLRSEAENLVNAGKRLVDFGGKVMVGAASAVFSSATLLAHLNVDHLPRNGRFNFLATIERFARLRTLFAVGVSELGVIPVAEQLPLIAPYLGIAAIAYLSYLSSDLIVNRLYTKGYCSINGIWEYY